MPEQLTPRRRPPLVVSRVQGGVATVTINRPEQRNAVTWEMITRLRRHLAKAKENPDVRVVVLTGAGDQAFCAGADLGTMAEGASFSELHDARGELAELFRDLWALGMPTIAKVRGFALAGGFGLALACDMVIAADDATFGAPEISVGLWPHQITVPLTRSMPPKIALELMMTGRRVHAEEAKEIGFVNRVVPNGDLDAEVDALAQSLASQSPLVLRMGRDAFYRTLDMSADQALGLLHPMLTVTAHTNDAAEGIAAFREKRDPKWTGT